MLVTFLCLEFDQVQLNSLLRALIRCLLIVVLDSATFTCRGGQERLCTCVLAQRRVAEKTLLVLMMFSFSCVAAAAPIRGPHLVSTERVSRMESWERNERQRGYGLAFHTAYIEASEESQATEKSKTFRSMHISA